jgi:hypothetical protein
MAGNAETRERRGQSPALPPVMGPPASAASASQPIVALSGVVPVTEPYNPAADIAVARQADARRAAANAPRPGMTQRPQAPVAAALPPLRPEQVQANAAAQLSQYNVAQLSALQGLLPSRPEPIPVEDQIMQTMFDGATREYLLSQSPGASVEAAAAGQNRYMQMLAQILNPNPLLMTPTE